MANGDAQSTVVNSQEDAMEFLTFLLDALHEDLASIGKHRWALAQGHVGVVAQESSEWSAVVKSKSKSVVDSNGRTEATRIVYASPVSAIFHGIFRSEVAYTQRRVTSVTFQRFHCISLDVKVQRRRCSLEETLGEYFKEEVNESRVVIRYGCNAVT
jgi:ubiquitin C-terminal hydrolase